MSSRISMWVGLIGVAATIPLVQTVAVAKSQIEVAAIATSISVLITSPSGQGSGVIFQQQGDVYTVLTAAHVVKKKVSYQITTSDEKEYKVISSSIISAPGDIDLAVVKFKATTKYPLAKLGNCNILARGMDLYVAGFPGRDRAITSSILVVREGKISANSNKPFDKGYSLIYSNDTMNGMSGGAVLNSNGELVAIHGIGNRDDDGRKNGYNLGIPIERFGTVAMRMGIELNGQVAAIPRDTALKTDDYIASAAAKYNKKDYQGSLGDLNRAIQLDPNSDVAHNQRGALKAFDLHDITGGLADLDRAIQLSPNYARAYRNRCGLKGLLKKNDQGALADCNRAIQLSPNDAIAYNNRGGLKAEKLQDYQGALLDYNRAIQLSSDDATAYTNRGVLKEQQFHDYQGALSDYNRAIQLSSNYATAYANRGNLKDLEFHDYQGALADYNRAIQLNPNNFIAYRNRGTLKYLQLHDDRGALADYNRAIQISSTDAMAYNNRGVLKDLKLNDYQGALSDYNRAIQLKPYAKTYYHRAILKFNGLKDRSGAINDMKQVAKLYKQEGNAQGYQDAIDLLKKW